MYRHASGVIALGVGLLIWTQPIHATDAGAIDPAKDCTFISVKYLSDITKALTYPNQYLKGDRYVLCFKMDAKITDGIGITQPLNIGGKDKPLVIYGLALNKPDPKLGLSPSPYVALTGTNVTLQHVTLTGPGPDKVGAVGIKLSGNGHQLLDSTIAGFDTGIVATGNGHQIFSNIIHTVHTGIIADCAWPKDAIGSYGPSCTIGPNNTIGVDDPADTTGKKLVTVGIHVPATGQQVTVTQNTITTELDKNATITKRVVLDQGANDNVAPPLIITTPKTDANLWATFNPEQTIITSVVGTLSEEGIVELFHELFPMQFVKTCTALKKDATHYSTLNVPDGQWLFECNKISIPVANARASVVYTHDADSSVFEKIDLSDFSTFIAPAGTVTGEGGAVMGGPVGSGLGDGEMPGAAPPVSDPGAPDEKPAGGTTVAAMGGDGLGGAMNGSFGGAAKGCTLVATTAEGGLGAIVIIFAGVVLLICMVRRSTSSRCARHERRM